MTGTKGTQPLSRRKGFNDIVALAAKVAFAVFALVIFIYLVGDWGVEALKGIIETILGFGDIVSGGGGENGG